MKGLYDLLKKLLISVVAILILAFPITAFLQWVGPENIQPYDKYKVLLVYLWEYLYQYGDWVIVGVVTFVLIGYAKNFYPTAEQIRMNRLVMELKRWNKTPYISPYLFYSLIAPRSSYSSTLSDRVFNEYYKTSVDLFRDRVFIDSAFTRETPDKPKSWVHVAGLTVIIPFFVCVALIIGIFVVLLQVKPPELWFTGWDKFTIPFLAFLSSWAGQLLLASYYVGTFKDIKNEMVDYFKGEEPRITWREVFPDKPKGKAIILAWQHETNKRNNLFYEFELKVRQHITNQKCPSIPNHPFPDYLLPDWADNMEGAINQFIKSKEAEKHSLQKDQIRESKGKVVTLNRKRR